VCEPGLPLEVWLETLPEPQRLAAEKILAVVRRHAGLIIEAVNVGVFVKRDRTLIELRPKQRWLQLSFISAAAITSPRIARTIPLAGGTAYFVRVPNEATVDTELRGWLAKSLRDRA
jgi:hypothetical protein